MSVLERVFPRLAKSQSTTQTADKTFVAMHWDENKVIYASDSLNINLPNVQDETFKNIQNCRSSISTGCSRYCNGLGPRCL